MEVEFQNLQLNDEDLQSYSYPLRDGEAPLPVKSMCKEYVRLLAKFITTYRDQITLPTNEITEPDVECYENLAFLLSMLKDLSIKDIIDYDSGTEIGLVRGLKARNFGGSWFDSLESLLVDNAESTISHKLKLLAQETTIRNGISNTWGELTFPKDGLSSEEAKILRRRIESLKSELEDVMEKRKALSVARKPLKFFYPV